MVVIVWSVLGSSAFEALLHAKDVLMHLRIGADDFRLVPAQKHQTAQLVFVVYGDRFPTNANTKSLHNKSSALIEVYRMRRPILTMTNPKSKSLIN